MGDIKVVDNVLQDNLKRFKGELETLILGCDKTVIVPHNRADYDAIGSALGLTMISKKFKKPSYVLVDDPIYSMEIGLRQILDEAKDMAQVINKEKYLSIKGVKDLVILTDVSNSKLISIPDELPKDVAVIDHHDPTPYLVTGKCNLVDSSVSSASEIVTRLLKLYKIKIPANLANYLLAGIYLDTNHFDKISKSTTSVMTDLLEAGASMGTVRNWFIESFESHRRITEVVNNVKFYTLRFAVASGNPEIEYTREELAKIADSLLKFGADASFAIGETGSNNISISARSNGPVNVGMIVNELDGGGNPRAAAVPKIEGQTLDEVEKSLIKVIRPKYYIKEETN